MIRLLVSILLHLLPIPPPQPTHPNPRLVTGTPEARRGGDRSEPVCGLGMKISIYIKVYIRHRIKTPSFSTTRLFPPPFSSIYPLLLSSIHPSFPSFNSLPVLRPPPSFPPSPPSSFDFFFLLSHRYCLSLKPLNQKNLVTRG